jgi:hypothetical protein
LAGLAALLALASPARAGFIATVTADVSPAGGDLFRYEYTLFNDFSSDFDVIDFSLDVAANADLQSITAPDGWTVAYTPGSVLYYSFSGGPDTDIAPGQVTTFSFLSPLAPALQNYSISGLNPDTFDFDTLSGAIASPSVAVANPVPAPPGVVLAAIGGLSLLGHRWRFGWRRPA